MNIESCLRTVCILFTLILAQACGSKTEFSSTGKLATTSSSNDASIATPDPDTPSTPNPTAEPTSPPTDDCPKINQNILVLDFKSGWWGGDAGTFFKTLLTSITTNCQSLLTVEYHHVIVDMNTMSVFPNGQMMKSMPLAISSDPAKDGFLKQDWRGYHQIWFLSGADWDSEDLRIDDPFFAGIKQRAISSGANLLVGAGLSSVYHANALVADLGYPSSLFEKGPIEALVSPTSNVKVLTRFNVGQQLSSSSTLFVGLQSIADEVEIQGPILVGLESRLTGDSFIDSTSITVVGKYPAGTNVIGVSRKNDRRIVFDAGLQRFYSVWNTSEKDTLRYLKNIVIDLVK